MPATNWTVEPNSPVHKVWKPELYKIQLDAPTPLAVLRQCELPPQRSDEAAPPPPPSYYGYEYHGLMNHKVSESILGSRPDGSYLIRKSPPSSDSSAHHYDEFHTLSLRSGGRTKHFKIYYRPESGHFVHTDFKRFETIHDLVADGLVNFYMQLHAAPIIQAMMAQTRHCYQQSPYMTLNRRKLRALSNDLRKSLKYSDATDSSAAAATSENIVTTTVSPQASAGSSQDDLDVLPVVYEKAHHFKVHTFKGLNWCEFCANFLWGFTAQGVKCEDCGFMAHNKCSELVPAKCVPDLKRIRGVFGADLTTLVAAHQCTIPFVVKRCVEEVEARGMLQEGIYRVSGFADEIDTLKLALDRDGEKTNMSEAAYGNVNVIAGTLKLYLRLLPVPLVTYQAYPAFMSSTKWKTIDEQVAALRAAMKQLPPAHFNCLKFMIEHLCRISSHHAVNKMTEHNLATVFAPTLIATPPHMTDLSQEIFMLTTLITHCVAVYGAANGATTL